VKTKGFFYNNRQVHSTDSLPHIDWVERLKILGIHHGSSAYQNAHWVQKIKEMRDEIAFYRSLGSNTLQHKAILSKSKLLPIFSYISNVYPMPNPIIEQIDSMLLLFIVSHDKGVMNLYHYAASKSLGGYCIDYISLHCSLYLLRPIIQYIMFKALGEDIPYHLHYVEYFLGLQICSIYGFQNSSLSMPHALVPNPVYNKCYELLRKYQITIDECVKAQCFSRIYKRIVNDYALQRHLGTRYYRIHSNFFPEYLKSFNYRLYNNMLPLNIKFASYALDTDSRCYFCQWGPENEWHVFGKCVKLKPLWKALDEVVRIAFNIHYSFLNNRTVTGDYDIVSTRCPKAFEDVIIYLNSIVNHKIYQFRNEIKYDSQTFDVELLFSKILRSVAARKRMETHLTQTMNIEKITELYSTLQFVKNIFDTFR